MAIDVLDRVQLVNSRRAPALLDISPRQLDRLVALGRIEPVRLTENGNRRFRVGDLLALQTTKGD